MKKLFAAALVILIVFVLLASSCASNKEFTRTATYTTMSPTYPSHTYSPPKQTFSSPPAVQQTLPAPVTSGGGITVPATKQPMAGGAAGPAGGTPGGYYNSNDNLGLAVGGAKDINNFRDNIRNNYLPLPTDITYEGLFYDYFFDTGQTQPATKLFSPSYSYAASRDPLSHRTDYYLSVGLNSGLKESDFQRKRLNLAIVLDTSGSMNENYNRYYYDNMGVQHDLYSEEGIDGARKIDSGINTVASILDQLKQDDRFAIVQFNSSAFLVKPMGTVSQTNMVSVKNKVFDLVAGGSTNMEAGMELAAQQIGTGYDDNYDYENRIILITDAQPNTGDYSSTGLMGQVKDDAQNRIYTTFIGIGVDFNTQLIEILTKTNGANYYTVHSPAEFRERIDQEFDYMVTPLVFNLQMDFISQGWAIDKVFGSPEANEATGRLMTINTMFPSKSEGGQTKGGLVLLKLRKISSSSEDNVYLKVSYQDRNGRWDSSQSVINISDRQTEYFDNSGIEKGILLARYACLMKNWLTDERQHLQYSRPWDPCINEDIGIIVPPEFGLSEWERQSMPLTVSQPYHNIFQEFKSYFTQGMQNVNDYTLDQELEILNKLAG